MNILHINTYNSGGAFRAGYRFHEQMNEIGVSSEFLVLDKTVPEPDLPTHLSSRSLPSRILESIRYRLMPEAVRHGSQGLRSYPTTAFRIQSNLYFAKADIVNLHWVAGFIDYSSFFSNQSIPVFWTIHDLNPLLGLLHFDFNASNLTLAEQQEESKMRHKKLNILQKAKHVNLIAPSRWMYERALESGTISRTRVHHIPYGINCSSFRPKDKEKTRRKHKMSLDRKVLLFVSESLEDERKGLSILVEALSLLRDLDLDLITVGGGKTDLKNSNVINFGSIGNKELLTDVYSMADLFIIPSIQDNLPNTVIEAMACGTPAAGFAVGGIVDLIRPGNTGHLAQTVDAEGLATAIRTCLGDDLKLMEMGENARRMIETEFNIQIQANKYLELYRSLV